MEVMEHVEIAKILSPAGASDHHLVVVSGRSTVPSSTDSRAVTHRWRADAQILRKEGERELLWRHAKSLPKQPQWNDWLAEIARIRAHLFNRQIVQPIRLLPRRKDLTAMRDRLDNFNISNPAEARQHAELTSQLQLARLAAFPEESLDLLRIQHDLPSWPATKSQRAPDAVPLTAKKVVEYYRKLYSDPSPADSRIPASTSKLLVGRRQWPDKDDLARSFTAKDVEVACKALKSGKAPGLAGIPPTAFKCSPQEFHEFTAAVLNYLSDHDCDTNSAILGRLLFKAKPGNAQTEVAHYRPISVSDADRRLLHGVLTARIVAQVDKIIPHEQTGFIPGRSISSNVSVLTLIAEAATRGWLPGPIVVLEQDQAKVYDRVEHRWRDRVLEDMDTPERITRLLRNLYAGANIRFDLGELTEAVEYKRGLLQGAPDSPLWYTLTYQPFLDKYEASGAGVKVRFRNEQVRISYVAYADNSFFLSSEEDAKAYWAARRQYDTASGSQLNVKESSVTVLRPPNSDGPLPGWIEAFKEHFTVRDANDSFRCLGRYMKLSTSPATDEVAMQVSRRLRAPWGRSARFLSIFGIAHMINAKLLSKIWYILDVIPLKPLGQELAGSIRRRLAPLFNGFGRARIAWRLVTTPKHLGGLGVLDPTLMVMASLAAWAIRALARTDGHKASHLLQIVTEKWLQEAHGVSPARLVKMGDTDDVSSRTAILSRLRGNNIKHLESVGSTHALTDPGDGLPTHIVSAALGARLRLYAKFDWASLTPAEAASLPWYSPQFDLKPIHFWRTGGSSTGAAYRYGIEPPVGARNVERLQPDRLRHMYTELANLGLDTFAGLFWKHRGRPAQFSTAPPSFPRSVGLPFTPQEVARFPARFPFARRDQFPSHVTSAVKRVAAVWPVYLRALPSTLLSRLTEYAEVQQAAMGEVIRPTPLLAPDGLFPWRATEIAGQHSPSATTRAIRKALEPNTPVVPKWAGGSGSTSSPSRHTRRPHSDSEDDSDGDSDAAIPHAAMRHPAPLQPVTTRIDWGEMWQRVEEIQLPGLAKETWWLVLMGKAPVLTSKQHIALTQRWLERSVLCPSCNVKMTCHHAYVACPAIRKVWQSSWLVLRCLLSTCPEWSEPSDDDILTGFKRIEHGLVVSLWVRFRCWFTLTLFNIRRVYDALRARVTPITAHKLEVAIGRVSRRVAQDLLHYASGHLRGPSHLTSSDFVKVWITENTLFQWSPASLSLDWDVLSSCSPPIAESLSDTEDFTDDATLEDADGTELPPLPVDVEPQLMAEPEAVAGPPPQSWNTTNRQRMCRCCHIRRKLDDNTSLCVACWICAYKQQPDTAYNYDKWRLGKMSCSCDLRSMVPVVPAVREWERDQSMGRFVQSTAGQTTAGSSRGPPSRQAASLRTRNGTRHGDGQPSHLMPTPAPAPRESSAEESTNERPPPKKRRRQPTPPTEESTDHPAPTRLKQSTLASFLRR
ncbi:related to Retrovirus-related POL polyprotein [Sporisorium reilianum SRZ2]|uniref:Related to Retrovirus-related POL polyprotein n=1 Tax=Sporisorium reilianum (strain SRZ2) TaxID=999809 RepID=E6ZS79_SPORE|nr:related to Retrovirus-related POL polyprotein [Sporisorium reilianum SRZ2]